MHGIHCCSDINFSFVSIKKFDGFSTILWLEAFQINFLSFQFFLLYYTYANTYEEQRQLINLDQFLDRYDCAAVYLFFSMPLVFFP